MDGNHDAALSDPPPAIVRDLAAAVEERRGDRSTEDLRLVLWSLMPHSGAGRTDQRVARKAQKPLRTLAQSRSRQVPLRLRGGRGAPRCTAGYGDREERDYGGDELPLRHIATVQPLTRGDRS